MCKFRLSRYKQDRLIEHFVVGTTARTAASLCGVSRKTPAFYFLRLREIIAVVPVLQDDDADALAARILKQEHIINPAAVRYIVEGRVRVEAERVLIEDAPFTDNTMCDPAPL